MVDSMLHKSSRNVHEPIETLDQDLLGRHELAETILDRLCKSDVSIFGIYGGWGTGKTSLLNLLDKLNDERLQARQSSLYIKVIDAWKYEMTGSLFLPVVVALKKFAKVETISGVTKTKYLKRLGRIAILGASDIVLRRLGLSLDDARNLMNDAKEMPTDNFSYLDWENLVDDVENTHDAFAELVKVALMGLSRSTYPTERIVFCIDNLDRCSPENAISLLESVKNFLTVPGCMWVFAIDPEVIASYIFKKYEGTAVDGNSYLDKIIPEQYHLSTPSLEQDVGHMDEFLREITRELSFAPKLDWERFAHIPKIWRPRRLIKCARSLLAVCQATGDPRNWDVAFGLIMLYHTWPEFYEMLSFGSESHVGGVLVNFLPNDTDWQQFKRITIKERFSADPDLMHFIDKAFLSQYEGRPEQLIRDLIVCTNDLRRAGLP